MFQLRVVDGCLVKCLRIELFEARNVYWADISKGDDFLLAFKDHPQEFHAAIVKRRQVELALNRKDGIDVLFRADLSLQLTGHDPLRPLYVIGAIAASISIGLLELVPAYVALVLLSNLYLLKLHGSIVSVVNLVWHLQIKRHCDVYWESNNTPSGIDCFFIRHYCLR